MQGQTRSSSAVATAGHPTAVRACFKRSVSVFWIQMAMNFRGQLEVGHSCNWIRSTGMEYTHVFAKMLVCQSTYAG